jgi:transposase
LSDWVPEGHLSRFISETVEQLDVREFYKRYQGDGRRNRPYEPLMVLKILIYGYATGIFSSRKIEQHLEEDVAFRLLAAGNFPNFRTVATFRREHLNLFKEVFIQVVRLAQELAMVKLGLLAIDGSKVKANASKRKAMSYGRMKQEEQRLEEKIEHLVRKAQNQETVPVGPTV